MPELHLLNLKCDNAKWSGNVKLRVHDLIPPISANISPGETKDLSYINHIRFNDKLNITLEHPREKRSSMALFPSFFGMGMKEEPIGEGCGCNLAYEIELSEDEKAEIRSRAYQLWQARGMQPGNEIQNWLDAENDFREKYNISSNVTLK